MSKVFERLFEKVLWNCRFFVLFPVVFASLSAVVLFTVASFDIIDVIIELPKSYFSDSHSAHIEKDIVSGIIGAVDLYLIAVVLLIFSFGLYELFISKIDHAEIDAASPILVIKSLDQLKDKIAKVIVMVLVVSFFQRVLYLEYTSALDMLYFAASILVLALGLYFLHRGEYH